MFICAIEGLLLVGYMYVKRKLGIAAFIRAECDPAKTISSP